MYDQVKSDNLKLQGLGGQMTDMDNDFEEMMRMRNEAKKRLEEKFKDVYLKIKENKQHTINEGKKVNASLKAFQEKFTKEMEDLSASLNQRLKEESEYQEAELKRGHDRM